MPTKPALGPAQEAIRVMALHLPTSRPRPAAAPAPLAAPTPGPSGPDEIVLRSLMSVMGHGGLDHPVQGTTIQALLGALNGQK